MVPVTMFATAVCYLVCGRPKFVPTPTRGRLWTTFLTVAASGKLNMTATVESHRGRLKYPSTYSPKIKNFRTLTIECLLTSVGHEDFHSSVLQQVSSGKDGADLCEQPFSMKTFCIR